MNGPTGPLSLVNIVNEKQSGLSHIFTVKCSFCGHNNEVKSSCDHRTGSRGPLASNINTRAALVSLHAGIGNAHPNNLLSTMNIPSMNHRLFKKREREIGNVVENIARESCKLNLNLEKGMAEQSSSPSADGLVGIAVSYDMGWQKRGRVYNSSTGHGAAMGLATGKVVSYSTRCKIFFLGGGGYHPTLKLSGIPAFTFIVSVTHRMDNM